MRSYDELNASGKRKQIGIKWKMFTILICFVSLFAIAIWVFQAHMLNYFYQTTKFHELDDNSNRISRFLDKDADLYFTANNIAREFYTDIWVFRINESDSALERMVFAEGSGNTASRFWEINIPELYERALDNDGKYIAMIHQSGSNENFEFNIIKDNSGSPNTYPLTYNYVGGINTMHLSVYGNFLIVQCTMLTPLSAVVKTLENQILFMGITLILMALIMAFIMSKLITKPLEKINDTAKNLANGNYDTDFSVHGYREIDELAQTLNFAAKELSKNDRLQKELISNISHDLRTPLTMIKGYSEVMRDIPEENTPENVQVIIDETERLTNLVNDMLDLSKIQSGARSPEMKEFCLTETVRATMFRYEKLTMQDGYKIEFSADRDVKVIADSGMILQVVYNLINNAINYTGEDKYVSVLQSVSNDRVRISVSDTGEGISQDEIQNIWDRYYKVDKVHRRATIGTGLGLSIVKEILEVHGAAYGVDSILGKGSTFWFELKRSEIDAEIVE